MLLRRGMVVVVALWAFCLANCAAAQRTIVVPSPGISTIQQGIDAAGTGDTVLVSPGTYKEVNVIDGKEITLTSQGGPDQTFLQGVGDGHFVLEVTNTPSTATTISGFSISSPYTASDGCMVGEIAIFVSNGGATVQNNMFVGDAEAVGVTDGTLAFKANVVNLVAPPSGSLAYPLSGTCPTPGELGVFVGGISKVLAGGKPVMSTISGNQFQGNGSGSMGVLAEDGSALQIDHNQFTGNLLGLELSEMEGTTVVENNLFAFGTEGGVQVDHSLNNPPSDPADTFVINNTFFQNVKTTKIQNPNTIPGEAAEVRVTGTYSRVALIGNVFSTDAPMNPVLFCDPNATTNYGPTTPIIVDHNLFWNLTGPLEDGGTCPVPIGSHGNVHADPRFVSATDFHLSAGSPAIDAGTTGSGYLQSTDLDGSPRVQDGSGQGAPLIDMGAYEFAGGQPADATSLILTSSAYYLRSGNSLTLSAQLTDLTSAVPLGSQPVSLQMDEGDPQLVATDPSGVAVLPLTGLRSGLHTFVARFAGGLGSLSRAEAPATSVVVYVYVLYGAQDEPTNLYLQPSANPSRFGSALTLRVQSESPDGTHPGPITLRDDGVFLTTLIPDTSGSASYTSSTLPVGTHLLTASFAGDAAHEAGSATLQEFVIASADFSVGTSVPSITVGAGNSGSLGVTVGALGDFAGTVELQCSGLPQYVSCTFANANLQVAAGAPATTTLTIATDAVTNGASSGSRMHKRRGRSAAVFIPLLLLLVPGRKRQRRAGGIAMLVCLGLLLLPVSGCGDVGTPLAHAQPGTYTLQVQGTAVVGGVPTTHMAAVTLVITP